MNKNFLTQESQKIPAHEHVYRQLRNALLFGEYPPDHSLTLRGVSKTFGVSMTPVREALRRLVSEGGLRLTQSGRFLTVHVSPERMEELSTLRGLLEPELAIRALPRVHSALIDRLKLINGKAEQAIAHNRIEAYIRGNIEFHRTLYLRAQSPAMLSLVESIWLQLGPTMRTFYSAQKRIPNTEAHRRILSLLRLHDETGLREAVRRDVTGLLQSLVV